MKNQWTMNEDLTLKELHNEGLTYIEIARQLNRLFGHNRSRNSVVDRAHRINLPVRFTVAEKVEKPEVVKYLNNSVKPMEITINRGDGITILELTNKSCRYIVDDEKKLYCGCDVTRKSYCSIHAKLCYKGLLR